MHSSLVGADGTVHVAGMCCPAPTLAEVLIERPEWHARAACRGMGVDVFFVERGPGVDLGAKANAARAICAGCQVRAECTGAGMGERHGTWGGLTELQRRMAKRARRSAA